MSGITEQAMTKLTGKDNYGTPPEWVEYFELNYALTKFQIDACASDYNYKCDNYITQKMNLFRHELNKPFFMNPIYGKKGWHRIYGEWNEGKRPILQEWFNDYGTGDFVKYAHDQHFKHNSVGAVLLFANVSSSDYFKRYIGETPDIRATNECELFFPTNRIQFLDETKQPVGTPSLSSMVVVYDKRFSK